MMKKEKLPASGKKVSQKQHVIAFKKSVFLDIEKWKHTPSLLSVFSNYALNSGWSSKDIMIVKNSLASRSYKEQIAILEQYCLPPLENKEKLLQEDVQFVLEHLGLPTHYLYHKALESWDNYDWANYTMLEKKGTTYIKRVFALYFGSINEEDKYDIDFPPEKYFDTYEEAEAWVDKKSQTETNIYEVWIQEGTK